MPRISPRYATLYLPTNITYDLPVNVLLPSINNIVLVQEVTVLLRCLLSQRFLPKARFLPCS